jgi:tetratricopeptide (TPR) repeat protein
LDEAIVEFSQATRLEPSLSVAHLNLAIAFARSGRRAEAIAELELVLRLDPSNEAARAALRVLRQ